jgi:1-aminocyclopropane-1-carboxylate deaminase
VAAAGKLEGFKTVGVIRGEELASAKQLNPTLDFAKQQGMHLLFVDRSTYKEKESEAYLSALRNNYPEYLILPEGGTNSLAVKGCAELLPNNKDIYDYICVSVGTGGTMAGIVNSSLPTQQVIGFSALKGNPQQEILQKYTANRNYTLIDNYAMGGYAKVNSELIGFINDFKKATGIPLDPIYTGKMMFGISDLIKKGKFRKNSRIFAVHTGGLQGIAGMNQYLKKKNLPTIHV